MIIYKTTNNVNGKIYVGQSKNDNDEDYLGSGKILKRAILKYGVENFTKEIVEHNIETKELLNEREIYWIDFYNATDSNIGYNIANGGQGGDTMSNHPNKEMIIEKVKKAKLENPYHHSKEERERISKRMIGECNPNYGKVYSKEDRELHGNKISGENNGFYGKTHSEEFKQKQSLRMKGSIPWNKGGVGGTAGKIWIVNENSERKLVFEEIYLRDYCNWQRGKKWKGN